MSKGHIPYQDALEAAHLLIANLAPWCRRIEYAGSLRRILNALDLGEPLPKEEVGDVEMLAIAVVEVIPAISKIDIFGELREVQAAGERNLLWARIDELGEGDNAPYGAWVEPDKNGRPDRKWGAKYRRMAVPMPGDAGLLHCDFFLTTEESWGYQQVLRTGPGDWNKLLVTGVDKGGLAPRVLECKDAQVHRYGSPIAVPTEEEFFRLWGLPSIPPYLRSEAEARRLKARPKKAA
jgi:DNA polymerase/3'-5' exonuclease PolX